MSGFYNARADAFSVPASHGLADHKEERTMPFMAVPTEIQIFLTEKHGQMSRQGK
jgi:hypothetical protein